MSRDPLFRIAFSAVAIAGAVFAASVPGQDEPDASNGTQAVETTEEKPGTGRTNVMPSVESRAPASTPRPAFRPKEEVPVDMAVDFPSDI